METQPKEIFQPKEYASNQDVRWCSGCGDYAILSAIKKVLSKKGKRKEDAVFVSGIGCSSRLPYYLDTYGMHSIHGRAAAIATGLKLHNPDLSVWVITGDGDCLAIGGNHFIHTIRRNVDLNILIFNNEIYGLTKGQYSPTSQMGKKTKTSPYGTVEPPFSPAKLALGAGATFFARSATSELKHLENIIYEADAHNGTSVVEIFQNCVIFNNDSYDDYFSKENRAEKTVKLEEQKEAVFGKDNSKLLTVSTSNEIEVSSRRVDANYQAFIHDRHNLTQAFMLSSFEEVKALGVLYQEKKVEFTQAYKNQQHDVEQQLGHSNLKQLIFSGDTWGV